MIFRSLGTNGMHREAEMATKILHIFDRFDRFLLLNWPPKSWAYLVLNTWWRKDHPTPSIVHLATHEAALASPEAVLWSKEAMLAFSEAMLTSTGSVLAWSRYIGILRSWVCIPRVIRVNLKCMCSSPGLCISCERWWCDHSTSFIVSSSNQVCVLIVTMYVTVYNCVW